MISPVYLRIICFKRTSYNVSLWRRAYAWKVRLSKRFLYQQYTNVFIFRFVSQHCLRSTLRLFHFRSVAGLVLVILLTSEPMLISATIALILIILILVYFLTNQHSIVRGIFVHQTTKYCLYCSDAISFLWSHIPRIRNQPDVQLDIGTFDVCVVVSSVAAILLRNVIGKCLRYTADMLMLFLWKKKIYCWL